MHASISAILLLCAAGCAGCTTLGLPSADVPRSAHASGEEDSETLPRLGSDSAAMKWASGIGKTYSRAWEEMKEDWNYDKQDSFANLSPEMAREVRMMRSDLSSASDAINTSKRNSGSSEDYLLTPR